MKPVLLWSSLRNSVMDRIHPAQVKTIYREIVEDGPPAPSATVLNRLRAAWGNQKWSAETPYLMEVAKQAQAADGPIVECGSGLTTLVLAAYAPPHVSVWALEDNPIFLRRVQRIMRQLPRKPRVTYAPLQSYGEYEWYKVPTDLPDHGISLVICDGPPASVKGGRVGALPVLYTRLSKDFRILLDDAQVEYAALSRWKADYRISERFIDGERSTYALITPE